MKAVICDAIGEPVRVVERETPEPGAGEVLIEVQACGLNYVDALICRGGYQVQPKMPYTPGSEFAGTVVGVGPGVEGFSPGNRVLGRGGYVSDGEGGAVPGKREQALERPNPGVLRIEPAQSGDGLLRDTELTVGSGSASDRRLQGRVR